MEYEVFILSEKYKSEKDIPSNLLSEKQILEKINYPIEYHKKDIKTYGEEFIIDLIFDAFTDPTYEKYLSPHWEPSEDYFIIAHTIEDYNLTDRGTEDISYCMGYTIEEA